ncbi:MAG: DivIVA domain-containing protein [Bacilli bacterium]|jgi:cell division initiation protein|nr:DivIVA domain-containing protein [Bacilli bacterium]
MEKFTRTLRGYDPVEVNSFLDKVIKQVELMVGELNEKDEKLARLSSMEKENELLKQKLEQYRRTEETMNKAIMMAQKTSDQMRIAAHNEAEAILDDAKRNANRIVNEALLRAEKTEHEANMLKRNINIFKRRLRSIIEAQLELVDEIDQVDM